MVGSEEELILDCYRLARWYHQSPDAFLEMPLSEVQVHMMRTLRLAKIMRAAASDNGD